MKRSFAFLAACALATSVYADAPNASNAPATAPSPTTDASATASPFTLNAEADFTTCYMFRGYNQGDHGLIFQPTITAGYQVYSSDSLTITPHLNLWGNITDKSYHHLNYWDELDVTPGVDFVSGKFTFTAEYLAYISPANNFGTTHELGGILTFDDTGLTKLPFALSPYISVYQELSNPNKAHTGTYFELGINPQFKVANIDALQLTVPVKFGGGFSQYYTHADGRNALAGFAQIGLSAKYSLTEHFYIHAEADYFQLLSQSTKAANGRDNKVVGTIGIGYDF